MTAVEPPLAMLAELTHRCPLRCPYCSNPVELSRASAELDTETWKRVLGEAAALGVLQVHFSGGEPLVRRDLAGLVRHAAEVGLYGNLITSGINLDSGRLSELVEAGLEHVQLSFQDADMVSGDRIAGLHGSQEAKRRAARLVRKAGLPLTVNAVVHRQNLGRLGEMIELAVALGADRLEVAHVQYYGWALRNRAALLPSRDQLDAATAAVEAARERLAGVLVIDYVLPDYYAHRPKACMGGWGRRFLNVTPAGKVLPCHAAETLTGLDFPTVAEASLSDIWYRSSAFGRFRGTDWMPEPCRSCDRREIDWGGCRCQAFALIGDAARTDPACALSPDHGLLVGARADADEAPPDFVYRQHSAASRRVARARLITGVVRYRLSSAAHSGSRDWPHGVKTLCRRRMPTRGSAERRRRSGTGSAGLCLRQDPFRSKRMIGRTLAVAVAVLLSTQVHAQSNQNSPGPAQGVVSGPAAGSPTSMRSPQAGPLETKHQRKAIHDQSQSVRNKTHPAAGKNNDETGATGSSSPRYAPAPK